MSSGSCLQRVVLIAEASAEQPLIEEIERLDFPAYSSVNCNGRSSRPVVSDLFAVSSHVRIEALGPADCVNQLIQLVQDELKNRFSITCFLDYSVKVHGFPQRAL